jgi:hypothetical protein
MNDGERGFALATVAHLMRPWGSPVRELSQLREAIATAPDEVLFQHTVQHPLRDPATEAPAPDDLSAWVRGVLRDPETAERISFAAQTRNASSALIRAALLEIFDAIPEKRRADRITHADGALQLLASVSVSFASGTTVRDEREMVDALLAADAGSWFLHLIEEPWYTGHSTLLEWLDRGGMTRLAKWLREAAASGQPIEKWRSQLARRWGRSQIAQRVAQVANQPEPDRREAGRQAIARLVRGRQREEEAS